MRTVKTASLVEKISFNDMIKGLVMMRDQIQYLHWQTDKHSEHKAFDWAYEEISSKLDELVEVYQGKYDRVEISGEITVINKGSLDVADFIDNGISMLSDDSLGDLSDKDTDLLNIRDEVVGILNKLKYLLTLK